MKWDSASARTGLTSDTMTCKVFAHVIIMCDGKRSPYILYKSEVESCCTKMHGTDEKVFHESFLASFSKMKENGLYDWVATRRVMTEVLNGMHGEADYTELKELVGLVVKVYPEAAFMVESIASVDAGLQREAEDRTGL